MFLQKKILFHQKKQNLCNVTHNLFHVPGVPKDISVSSTIKFSMVKFRIVYLAQVTTDLNTLGLKIQVTV